MGTNDNDNYLGKISPSEWKGTWREDWRIAGQESYLKNKVLQHRLFDRSICVEDYTQCEFCWALFDKDKDNPIMAYFQPDEKVWVCEECFNDFNRFFHWTVEELNK